MTLRTEGSRHLLRTGGTVAWRDLTGKETKYVDHLGRQKNVPSRTCPACGKKHTSWDRYCASCQDVKPKRACYKRKPGYASPRVLAERTARPGHPCRICGRVARLNKGTCSSACMERSRHADARSA